eukprot:360101-Chlamydomonas_euryale.AAC.4
MACPRYGRQFAWRASSHGEDRQRCAATSLTCEPANRTTVGRAPRASPARSSSSPRPFPLP